MRELELVLRALSAANLATPQIVAIINAVKGSVADGRTDEEILEHAAAVAQETKSITEADMGDQP